MTAQVVDRSVENRALTESERVVAAYLAAANGDAHRALHAIASDALTDLCEAERRCGQRDRLISSGYLRALPGR